MWPHVFISFSSIEMYDIPVLITSITSPWGMWLFVLEYRCKNNEFQKGTLSNVEGSPNIFWCTYTQSCLSSLLRISLSRKSSQHLTAVWNIVSLQLRAPTRTEFTDILSVVRSPQWYNTVCTSRRTSFLSRESDVPVRQVSMVDDKQNSSSIYSCLY